MTKIEAVIHKENIVLQTSETVKYYSIDLSQKNYLFFEDHIRNK